MKNQMDAELTKMGDDLSALFPGETFIFHALEAENERFGQIAARRHEIEVEMLRITSDPERRLADERIAALETELRGLLSEVAGMIAARKAE